MELSLLKMEKLLVRKLKSLREHYYCRPNLASFLHDCITALNLEFKATL